MDNTANNESLGLLCSQKHPGFPSGSFSFINLDLTNATEQTQTRCCMLKKNMRTIYLILFIGLLLNSCGQENQKKEKFNSGKMMIRIAEIEIEPDYLDEYLSILKKEAKASVDLEPGVISIYPMFQKESTNEIRILEIYADREAYEAHLQTPHFKHYKSGTLQMVKSLKLIDMTAIDEQTMPKIFKKIGE